MKLVIKHLLTAIVILVGVSTISARTDQEPSEMSRKEKRIAVREQLYQQNQEMLENRSFVLESHFLQNRYGNRIPVNSTINFIMVDGDEAVIQIGSNTGLGHNGVGGITARGRIAKWNLSENEKKKTFDLSMNVVTSIGVYDLNLTVGAGLATARLTGLQPGNLTFSGDFVSLDESIVYEGRSL